MRKVLTVGVVTLLFLSGCAKSLMSMDIGSLSPDQLWARMGMVGNAWVLGLHGVELEDERKRIFDLWCAEQGGVAYWNGVVPYKNNHIPNSRVVQAYRGEFDSSTKFNVCVKKESQGFILGYFESAVSSTKMYSSEEEMLKAISEKVKSMQEYRAHSKKVAVCLEAERKRIRSRPQPGENVLASAYRAMIVDVKLPLVLIQLNGSGKTVWVRSEVLDIPYELCE